MLKFINIIVDGIGRHLFINQLTNIKKHIRYAQVCIEVSIDSDFLDVLY